jgi:hypothetical protein
MRPKTPCQFQTAGFLIEICFTDFLGVSRKWEWWQIGRQSWIPLLRLIPERNRVADNMIFIDINSALLSVSCQNPLTR